MRFNLSVDPIELEPLVVTVVRNSRLERRGYYERREIGEKVGNGVFFDIEEIRKLMPSRVTNLLQWVPGVRIDCSGGVPRPSLAGTRESLPVVAAHRRGYRESR